jgi:hypothetical protein
MDHQDERWRTLCERAANEQDLERLLQLVREMNRLLIKWLKQLTTTVCVEHAVLSGFPFEPFCVAQTVRVCVPLARTTQTWFSGSVHRRFVISCFSLAKLEVPHALPLDEGKDDDHGQHHRSKAAQPRMSVKVC